MVGCCSTQCLAEGNCSLIPPAWNAWCDTKGCYHSIHSFLCKMKRNSHASLQKQVCKTVLKERSSDRIDVKTVHGASWVDT